MFGKNKPDPYASYEPKQPAGDQLRSSAELAECRRRIDELESRHVPTVALQQTIGRIDENLAALYKHMGIQRVKVTTTEEILSGLHDLVTSTREEMRKVKGK